MDKLDVIFDMQRELDEFLAKKRGLVFTPEEWMQKQSIALICELSEFLEQINYKWWKNPKETDSAAVKEELVDVLHFFVGMCIKAGMTADEMFDIYYKKNEENFNRQSGLSQKKGYE